MVFGGCQVGNDTAEIRDARKGLGSEASFIYTG